MKYTDIVARVNAAMNFFADTKDVNYMEGFSAVEVMEYDSENKQDVWVFPELKKMGY